MDISSVRTNWKCREIGGRQCRNGNIKKITIEDTWDGKSTHVKYIDDKLIGHKTENCPRWDTAYLQELGAQGWEMVLCQNHTHYFKRPIEE